MATPQSEIDEHALPSVPFPAGEHAYACEAQLIMHDLPAPQDFAPAGVGPLQADPPPAPAVPPLPAELPVVVEPTLDVEPVEPCVSVGIGSRPSLATRQLVT